MAEQWGHPVSDLDVFYRSIKSCNWGHSSCLWLTVFPCYDFTRLGVVLPPFVLPVPKTCYSCHALGLARVSVFDYCLEKQCCVWAVVCDAVSQLPVPQGFLTCFTPGLLLAATNDHKFVTVLGFNIRIWLAFIIPHCRELLTLAVLFPNVLSLVSPQY